MSPSDRGGGPPRPPAPASVPSVYNVPQRPILTQFLGDFLGVVVHWVERGRERKSEACLGDPRRCCHCRKGKRPSFTGYAPAALHDRVANDFAPVALCVSPLHRDDFPPPLAGKFFGLVHNGKGRRAKPLTVSPRRDLDGPLKLAAFSVVPSLLQIFGLRSPDQLTTFDWSLSAPGLSDPVPTPRPPAPVPAPTPPARRAASPAEASEEEWEKFREWRAAVARGDEEHAALVREELDRMMSADTLPFPTPTPREAEKPDATNAATGRRIVGELLGGIGRSARAQGGAS